jgi:hypothetical protein
MPTSAGEAVVDPRADAGTFACVHGGVTVRHHRRGLGGIARYDRPDPLQREHAPW